MNRRNFISTIIAAACASAVEPEPVYGLSVKAANFAGVELQMNPVPGGPSRHFVDWVRCVQLHSAGDIHDAT
jgi:hypothetical protein